MAAPLNTNHIPFWWDMLVVAAFSLVIYYWAMATRLPKAEMLNLVERQSGHRAARADLPPDRVTRTAKTPGPGGRGSLRYLGALSVTSL